MKILYLLFALAACLPTALFAQQTESKKRSAWHLTIPEVTVVGHRPMKEIGVQKTKFDSLALKENIALSMADILTFNSSVFVKSYGRATLSTVAFRGTSPSHTQVTWNGMRINNPMLGMTDFSTIPSYFIDNASLLHGMSETVPPWNVSTLAQAAGVAALGETEFLEKTRALVRAERAWLAEQLAALGFRVIPSDANYLLFRAAPGLDAALREQGILIRNCENYAGLCPGWYRIAVRTRAENEALIRALREV